MTRFFKKKLTAQNRTTLKTLYILNNDKTLLTGSKYSFSNLKLKKYSAF
jgi:hypothetical protein